MDGIGVILQARMGSQRLPGKVLKNIGDKPLLAHIVSRVRQRAPHVGFVVATSTMSRDDVIAAFCESNKTDCFRGSEENVLERYVQCMETYGFTQVVRLTGDNPFPDIDEMNCLIDFHLKQDLQYSENLSVLPEGVGMEIMSADALRESLEKSYLPKHFEHVDEYILDNLEQFRHGTCDTIPDKYFHDVRLTVDTSEDLQCARYIVEHSQGAYITTELAIRLRRQYEEEVSVERGR